MGFSAGFAAGWGAVDSAYRQKAEAEQRKIDNEQRAADLAMRQENQAQQRKEWQRADQKRQNIADAAATESQAGTSVGSNFATGAGDTAFLEQQAAAEAEMNGAQAPQVRPAASTGNEVRKFSDAGQAANFAAERQGDLGKVKRLADVEYRSGNTAGGMELESRYKSLVKEGYKEALDTLFQTGDVTKAQQLFDATGKYKIPGRLQATPVTRKGADGVEMPDYDLSIVSEDGSVRPLGSAITMRYQADGIENYRSMLANEAAGARAERTIGVAEKKTDLEEKRIAIQDRLAAAKEKRDDAQIKYWEGQLAATNRRIDLSAAKAAAGGSGGGKGDQPAGSPVVDRNDEKHIREIVGEMTLPKDADPRRIVDVASRIKALAPGISASEAATIASTPGATVRSVQTNKGVFDALEVPGREVVGKDGKKSTMPGGVYLMAPGARQIPVPRAPAAPAPPKLSAAQIAAMDAEKRAADAQAAQLAQQEAAAARAAATAAFARPR